MWKNILHLNLQEMLPQNQYSVTNVVNLELFLHIPEVGIKKFMYGLS